MRLSSSFAVSLLSASIHATFQTAAKGSNSKFAGSYASPRADHACFMPWISDAVLNPIEKKLDLILQPRCACEFNTTEWHELLAMYPQYKAQLADGLESNILQPLCPHKTHSLHRILIKQTILCILPRVHTRKVYRVRSQVIDVINHGFIDIAPLRVTCPLDNTNIDISSIDRQAPVTVRIPKELFILPDTSASFSASGNNKTKRNESPGDEFLASILTTYHSTKFRSHRNTDTLARAHFTTIPEFFDKKFEVAVCSVVIPPQRLEALYEWIEYHLHLGVDHFYLYNNPSSQQYTAGNNTVALSLLLARYIAANVVTVIPWTHEECVRGMGVGRTIMYANNTREFRPPLGINQLTGLASCYLRYAQTTRFMLSIDEDEFIVINPQNHSKHHISSDKTGKSRVLQTWLQDKLQTEDQSLAFAFKPLFAYSCPQRQFQRPNIANQRGFILRLDKSTYYGAAFHYEYKLLMDTSKVSSYFVHYAYQVHNPQNHLLAANAISETILNHSDAFLLHIRRFDTGSIFGQSLPLIPHQQFQTWICDWVYYLPLSSQYPQGKLYSEDKALLKVRKIYENNSLEIDDKETFEAASSQKLILDDELLANTRNAVKRRMIDWSNRKQQQSDEENNVN